MCFNNQRTTEGFFDDKKLVGIMSRELLKLHSYTDVCVCLQGQVTDTNRRLQEAGREVSACMCVCMNVQQTKTSSLLCWGDICMLVNCTDSSALDMTIL